MNSSDNEIFSKILKKFQYWQEGKNYENISRSNLSLLLPSRFIPNRSGYQIFYVVSTLIIIILGLSGNSFCFYRLVHKKVLRQSSAQYFGVFCIFNILVLIFYVVPEWLSRGIYPLTGVDIIGIHSNRALCHLYLVLMYWLRLVSVWALAAYSVDKYMGLKHPQCRRNLCCRYYNVKVIASLTIISLLVSFWKPYLGETIKSGHPLQVCAPESKYMIPNFVYDTIYACLLFIFPFILITIMNMLIASELLSWRTSKLNSRLCRQDLISFQFGALLILISCSFLLFSLPYFIFWVYWWCSDYQSKFDNKTLFSQKNPSNGVNLITRVLFYFHFGINIFLYTIASRYFKSQIKQAFTLRKLRKEANDYYHKK